QAKLDLILGFLQFQLALLDARLDVLDKRNFEQEQ
ncbi:CiaD-like domain-containing protein, partial [Helicobacter trogontum]